MRPTGRRLGAAVLLAVGLAGCGAKTGLRVDRYAETPPDTGLGGLDAAVARDAAVPQVLACASGRFALSRGSIDVMFVLDRSGSMADHAHGAPRRWDVLREVLALTLPPYEDTLAMGACAYPRRFDGSLARSCDLSSTIDIQPELHQAAAVVAVLRDTDPWGATPTAAAIDLVGSMLSSRITADRAAVMVLSTDGGPNCNSALDPGTCVCGGSCRGLPSECLDDVRTADTIASFAARGISTFVVGLDAAIDPDSRRALEAMARAGGRPSSTPGEPAYYSADRPEQIQAAFETIERAIDRCTLRSPSRPDDPDAALVQLLGVPIPRDPAHLDGWDWTEPSLGHIAFFGSACDRVAGSSREPEVLITCRDR